MHWLLPSLAGGDTSRRHVHAHTPQPSASRPLGQKTRRSRLPCLRPCCSKVNFRETSPAKQLQQEIVPKLSPLVLSLILVCHTYFLPLGVYFHHVAVLLIDEIV